MRNLLIALALATSYVSMPASALADDGDEKIIISNPKFSVVEVVTGGKASYIWRTDGGDSGREATAKDAKKAAKAARKAEKNR